MRSRKPEYGQTEVANAIGVSQSTLSRYLDRDPEKWSAPRYDDLQKLADFFQVSPAYFFEKSEEPMVIREGPAEYLIEDALAEAEEIRSKAMALEIKLRKLKK